jgi:hypothetical protein
MNQTAYNVWGIGNTMTDNASEYCPEPSDVVDCYTKRFGIGIDYCKEIDQLLLLLCALIICVCLVVVFMIRIRKHKKISNETTKLDFNGTMEKFGIIEEKIKTTHDEYSNETIKLDFNGTMEKFGIIEEKIKTTHDEYEKAMLHHLILNSR